MVDPSSAKRPDKSSRYEMPAKEALPADEAVRGGERVIGPIRIEAGPAFSAKTRLRVRGLNAEQEKEKVSLTLDRDLVKALRISAGPKRLSATVNQLLLQAMELAHLRALVDELESEAGPVSPDTYQELLDEWFADRG